MIPNLHVHVNQHMISNLYIKLHEGTWPGGWTYEQQIDRQTDEPMDRVSSKLSCLPFNWNV